MEETLNPTFLVGTVISVAAAIFSAVSAYQSRRGVQSGERAAVRSNHDQRRLATLSHVSSVSAEYRSLRSQLEQVSHLPELTSEEGQRLQRLLAILEHLATAVNNGILDLHTLDKLAGGFILATTQKFMPFIRLRRRDNPRIYDELDTLVTVLLELRHNFYRIDRSALVKLRSSHLLRDDEVSSLKSLNSNVHFTYAQLRQALTEIGLEKHRGTVVDAARFSSIRYHSVKQSSAPELVDLFAAVSERSNGEYPKGIDVSNKLLLQSYIFPITHPTEHRALSIGGQIVGHICFSSLPTAEQDRATGEKSAYWSNAFPSISEEHCHRYMLVSRFAVHPRFAKQGYGRILLRKCLTEIQDSTSKIPVLVVREQLLFAIDLYRSEGGRQVHEFEGHTGKLLSFIF